MGILEGANLEYKREVNNTFLKTVSAYSNYGDGIIVFGVSDNGDIVGVVDLDKACLSIENKINDSMSPIPDYELEINHKDKTIQLSVKEGLHKPYLYKNKAYKRADTSTVEIDRIELNRLILEGSNLNYEQLPAFKEELSFKYMEHQLIEHLGIHKVNEDILRTLDLYSSKTKYNRVAEILSDKSSFPGIDMVRFGNTIDEILDREIFDNMSILESFEKATLLFKKYYCYEEIVDMDRVSRERIPQKAFREALANAIVHRVWDIKSAIRIAMFDDHIEIVSPGGLPAGLSAEEYTSGQISLLRNPILGNLFFRLRYIEKFGTGIRRIIQSYKGAIMQPEFKVHTHSITISLPVFRDDEGALSPDENVIFRLLEDKAELSRKEIEEHTKFSKDKVIRLLNRLIENNAVTKKGNGRNTKYLRKA